jgi:STE24 endopeptidase
MTEERARTYHRWHFLLSLAGIVLGVSYLGLLLLTGAALALRDRLSALGLPWWLELPLALIVLGGAYGLLALPLSLARGFFLPRRFGLLHQPLARWLRDAAKALLLAGTLLLVGAETVYGLIRLTPWWWAWGAAVFLAGNVLVAWVAPVWLVPLFYRLTPLPEGALRSRLLALTTRVGVPVLGIWVADQSRKSRTANAAVTGLGHTRRVILFDTLIEEFSPEQVEVVLAHELAHHVHGDIPRGLLVQGLLTLATFWAADHALRAGARALHLEGPADLAGLPLLGLILMGTGVLALPMANSWSRHVERQADDFALGVTEDAGAFIGAMQRLGALNLAEEHPNVVKEFFLHSHPSIGRRVARARARARPCA